MNRTVKLTAAFVICTAASFCVVGGCAKRNDRLPETRTRQAVEESGFASGAGRAPTAATSYSFAKILVSQGRDRDALYVLSQIIREHPKYLPAYNEMAGVYMRADRLDDAIAAITTGLEQSPRDGVLHNNLGMCYLLKDEPQKALEAFTHATDAVPNSATFRSNRAAALVLTARDAEAESEYRTVVGTLQARQNVLALAKAREGRSKLNEEQGRMDPAQPIQVQAARVQAAAPAIKTAPVIVTPAPTVVEAAPAIVSPAPSPAVKTPAPTTPQTPILNSSSPVDRLDATSSLHTRDGGIGTAHTTATTQAAPLSPGADAAIRLLARAFALRVGRWDSSVDMVEPTTPLAAPVADNLSENAAEASESEESL